MGTDLTELREDIEQKIATFRGHAILISLHETRINALKWTLGERDNG